MNSTLLSNHLLFINSIKSEIPIVFIYKGFPINFIKKLNNFLPHIYKLSCINKKELINLNYISKNFWNIGTILNSPMEKKSFLLYEEFFLLPVHSIGQIPVEFIIIQNNFYNYFPNQADLQAPDIEKNVMEEVLVPENKLFNRFYANSKEIAGFLCIQYLDYDIDSEISNIKTINFFNVNELTSPSIENYSKPIENIIQFKASDNSYLILKFNAFFYTIPEEINILVDENIDHISEDFNELKILFYLLESNACKVTFFRKKRIFEDYWRKDVDELLHKHWGDNTSFKKIKIYKDPDTSNDLIEYSQGSIVEEIITQYEKAKQNLLFDDIFLTAPTGAGKSLLFQLPAIYLSENTSYAALSIVVSPLKALMADQVLALKNNRNYDKVAFLNSDLSLLERDNIIDQIKNGLISILYLSPELLLSYDIKTFIGERELGLLVIDEAHLVTTWGRDFRIDYWFLGNYIRKLRTGSSTKKRGNNRVMKSYRFPIIALTATAVYNGDDDMVYETIASLNMQNCKIYIGRIKREEIIFDFHKLETHEHEHEKMIKTRERIDKITSTGKKSIFYFPWINQIENIFPLIDPAIKNLVKKYHARLKTEERRDTLINFKGNAAKTVLATKAFGMGIDISDIEIVYHHAPSGNLADYVQEIGRLARIPGLTGKALIDFAAKDLKFTKILFGLSSLKQYQVNLVLKKINNLYQIKKNRNMLLSVQDFEYIFSRNENAEQKVKSALLVLEKDLIARYGYNVLIVRPKSLFSLVYGSVNLDGYKELKDRFTNFIEEIPIQRYEQLTTMIDGNALVKRSINTEKKFFKIFLDKLWENFYPEESFPSIKYKYFNLELFPNVHPLLRLSIYFNESIPSIKKKFEQYIKTLESCVFSLSGSYFTKDEFISRLKSGFDGEILCRKLADLLTVFYSEAGNFGKGNNRFLKDGNFIQTKRKENDIQYRIINTSFNKVRSQMFRLFNIMFDGIDERNNIYQDYISAEPGKNKEKIKMAYILEIFDLATYEVNGGELPQLFVRINDPQKINLLCNQAYSNTVVADVERRHKLSVEIMNYFFQKDMSNSQRWKFIETYFLGRELNLD